MTAGSEQYLVGIGKRCTSVERQPHAIRRRRDGNNAIGGALRRAETQDEEVVIIPNQLVRRGQPLSERAAQRADQGLALRLEFIDEALELLFRVGQ